MQPPPQVPLRSAALFPAPASDDRVSLELNRPAPLMALPDQAVVHIASFDPPSSANLRQVNKSLANLLADHPSSLKITDADDVRKAVTTFPHARTLDLSKTPGLTDEHVQNINKLSKLTDLSLAGTDVGDAGLAHLKDLPITTLNLGQAKILPMPAWHPFREARRR